MGAVRIELQVGGVADVKAAFRSVENEVVRSQKAINKSTEAGAKTRLKAATEGANAVVKAEEKAAADAAEAAEKSAAQAKRIADRKADQEIRSVQRKADRIERIEEASMRKLERWAEQHEAKITRDREAEATKRAKIAEREAKAEAQAKQHFRQSVLGTTGGNIKGAIGAAAGLAGAALTFGGAVTAADAIRGRMSEQDAAIGVSNASFMPEVKDANGKIIQARHERGDVRAIQANSKLVEGRTNIKAADLSSALQTYIEKSSDYEGGMQNLGGLAEMAKGTKSDIGDVMMSAGMLRSQNTDMTPEQMMSTMRGIIGQGQFGSISMADMAQHAATVSAGASSYGGDQTRMQGRLLGLMQVAGRAADPAEAATATARFGDDLAKKMGALGTAEAGKVKGPGGKMIQVADKSNKLLDPSIILKNLFDATKGDQGALSDILGERSGKVAKALMPTYFKAEAKKKGSGGDAVASDVDRVEGAGYSEKDVQDGLNAVMSSDSERLATAFNKLETAMGTAFLPIVEKLVDKLPELVPKIEKVIEGVGQLADFIIANPLESAIRGMGLLITKSIAEAAIGNMVSKALQSAVASSALTSVSMTAAAVTIAYEAGKAIIDGTSASVDGVANKAVAGEVNDDILQRRLARGDTSAIPEAQARIAALGEQGKEQKDNLMGKSFSGLVQGAMGGFSLMFGGEEGREAARAKAQAQIDQMQKTTAAAEALTAALEKLTGKAASVSLDNKNRSVTQAGRGQPNH